MTTTDVNHGTLINAIYAQNDSILDQLNTAEDGKDLEKVLDVLKFVAPVWTACSYGYKIKEIISGIRVRACALSIEFEGLRDSSPRKGYGQWTRYNSAMGELTALDAKVNRFLQELHNQSH